MDVHKTKKLVLVAPDADLNGACNQAAGGVRRCQVYVRYFNFKGLSLHESLDKRGQDPDMGFLY